MGLVKTGPFYLPHKFLNLIQSKRFSVTTISGEGQGSWHEKHQGKPILGRCFFQQNFYILHIRNCILG